MNDVILVSWVGLALILFGNYSRKLLYQKMLADEKGLAQSLRSKILAHFRLTPLEPADNVRRLRTAIMRKAASQLSEPGKKLKSAKSFAFYRAEEKG